MHLKRMTHQESIQPGQTLLAAKNEREGSGHARLSYNYDIDMATVNTNLDCRYMMHKLSLRLHSPAVNTTYIGLNDSPVLHCSLQIFNYMYMHILIVLHKLKFSIRIYMQIFHSR